MKAENELCRKVFDHHTVLKGEMSNSLLEIGTKSGLNREAITSIVNRLNAIVDNGSNKMVNDFQKTFKRINEENEK